MGLQRMPDGSLLLSYGKDDARAMAMTLDRELVDEWVRPLGEFAPQDMRFCTIGYKQPLFVMHAADGASDGRP
eukprot:82252-Chlamydomonas_euryale.AAC.3